MYVCLQADKFPCANVTLSCKCRSLAIYASTGCTYSVTRSVHAPVDRCYMHACLTLSHCLRHTNTMQACVHWHPMGSQEIGAMHSYHRSGMSSPLASSLHPSLQVDRDRAGQARGRCVQCSHGRTRRPGLLSMRMHAITTIFLHEQCL